MPKQIDDITKGKIRREYKAGNKTIKQIAQQFGHDEKTVRTMCRDLAKARKDAIAKLKAIAKQEQARRVKAEAEEDARRSGLIRATTKQSHSDSDAAQDPTVANIDDTIDRILAGGGIERMDLLIYHCAQVVLRTAANSKEGLIGAYVKMEKARHEYYPRTMRELADYMLGLPELDVNELMRELYKRADKAE